MNKQLLYLGAGLALLAHAGFSAMAQLQPKVSLVAETAKVRNVPDAAVIETRNLSSNVKMQICQDEKGFRFKRMVTASAKDDKITLPVQARRAVLRSEEQGDALNESFESWDGSDNAWLPDGWSAQKTEGLEYYNSWFVTAPTLYAPQVADGQYYAEILYAATPQDEWLITPDVTVGENDQLSFYIYFQPANFFDMGDGMVDWDTMEFVEKKMNGTIQIMISVEGGEWTLLRDLMDDYADMSLMDVLTVSGARSSLWEETADLSEYIGKSVKIAFRYVATDTDSVFLDAVRIGAPALEAAYMEPMPHLFWGFSKEAGFNVMPYSIAQYPVYTPLEWMNLTDNPAASYTWSYTSDPATGEQATSTDENLVVSYAPDFSTDKTKRNNFILPPTLTASAPGAASGSYTAPIDLFQVGGESAYLLSEDGLTKFGLLPFDLLNEGFGIMAVEPYDFGEPAVPIFGYSNRTTAWWTNHTFQGDAGENDLSEVVAINNALLAPSSPMVVSGLWLMAKGNVAADADVTFTASIFPCIEVEGGYVPSETPMVSASCKAADILVAEGGMQNLLTLPFDFESPVVLDDTYPMYFIKVSGFNNPAVEYFAPVQSLLPNRYGICYGYLDVQITFAGTTRISLSPLANFEGDYGECFNAFAINLDACYPWISPEEKTVEFEMAGGVKSIHIDSYYEASEYTFTQEDGSALPEWLSVSGTGRYNEAVFELTAAATTVNRECTVLVSAPGVKKTVSVSQTSDNGIAAVTGNTEAEIEGVYTLSGVRVDADDSCPGFYIVKYTDGTVRKVFVK